MAWIINLRYPNPQQMHNGASSNNLLVYTGMCVCAFVVFVCVCVCVCVCVMREYSMSVCYLHTLTCILGKALGNNKQSLITRVEYYTHAYSQVRYSPLYSTTCITLQLHSNVNTFKLGIGGIETSFVTG